MLDKPEPTQQTGAGAPIAPPPGATANLPAVVAAPAPSRSRRRPWRFVIVLLLMIGAAGGGLYWWRQAHTGLPPGIAWSNGRIEADEVDIDTKFAGRIAKLFVDEGDLVHPGQVVAMMDTQDLMASLKKSQALVDQAQRALDEAKANLVQQQTQVTLARQELDRSQALAPKGFATVEQLDQRRQQMAAVIAMQDAAVQRVSEAEHALDAATHDVELYRVDILDDTLVTPKVGPIEYRVANVGEVLPAGGKVFTMLDASYVYMDIYLPTAEAGRIRLGAEARIVLDAYPNHVIPATVVFVASQAQFTPKTVETKDERDKLMFRIRVRIDPGRLAGREALVRSGLPGVAYVRTYPAVPWPKSLQPSAPPSIPAPARP
jgi:HlyD family secretion protein